LAQTAFDYSERVVLITGATGGVGSVVSRAFVEAGARVALVSRSHDKLEDLAAQIGVDDTNCYLHACDLRQAENARAAVNGVVGCFGRLDTVINTIGSWEPGKVATLAEERYHDVLATNLHSVFYVLGAAVPHMGGGGSIINFGTEVPPEGKGGQLAYAVAKAGILTLTSSLALELKPRGVTVNAVLPRNVDTPGNRQLRPNADTSKWVKPEEIAQLLLFLASPAARAITGALIPIYGRE
jgi:NAD(P)-dependent dehydrogenase (short-subunit alcohol dehydrogenase family)